MELQTSLVSLAKQQQSLSQEVVLMKKGLPVTDNDQDTNDADREFYYSHYTTQPNLPPHIRPNPAHTAFSMSSRIWTATQQQQQYLQTPRPPRIVGNHFAGAGAFLPFVLSDVNKPFVVLKPRMVDGILRFFTLALNEHACSMVGFTRVGATSSSHGQN